jgi:ubiquinone/menaquinone biosynthesis C-methylase UbiE
MEPRKQREREFHNRRVEASQQDESAYRRLTSNKKFYSVTRGSQGFIRQWLSQRCPGKRVLDFGCGTGDFTCSIAKSGAETVGIDISNKSIESCKQRAVTEKVADRTTFLTMDAESLEFANDSFDIITCIGVLHHMDIEKAYAELARVLKPDGQVICAEPLAYNPLIQLYRKMTPHLRTAWEAEHILTRSSVKLAGSYFGKVETRFFHLATLAATPFRKLQIFSFTLSVLEAVDRVLLKIPLVKWLAWQVVFILSQPRPQPDK